MQVVHYFYSDFPLAVGKIHSGVQWNLDNARLARLYLSYFLMPEKLDIFDLVQGDQAN